MRVSSSSYRSFVGASIACGVAGALTLACSVTTGPCPDGSGTCTTLKTQTKYTSTTPYAGNAAYDGKPIVIENANGSLTVTGGAQATISATATPFAFADNEADADAAMADMGITIDETSIPGKIHVQCTQPRSTHGSAASGTAGCQGMNVSVPSGSAAAPINLIITGHNGDVAATALVGQTILHADNGNANLTITPVTGMAIESSSDNGDVTLRLPSDFAADKIRIEANNGAFTTTFSDITTATTTRGVEGTGAASVVLLTQNGNATLTSF